jgi:PAS domain S-box-containing protein
MTGAPVAGNISTSAGGRRAERRRPRSANQLPFEALQQMPALVVLERLPAPALAVDHVGGILFANGSFCEMVGYSPDELLTMTVLDLAYARVTPDCPIEMGVLTGAQLVQLRHKTGHAIWASMSRSAMARRDDTVALVTFCDRTEELWIHSAASGPAVAGW